MDALPWTTSTMMGDVDETLTESSFLPVKQVENLLNNHCTWRELITEHLHHNELTWDDVTGLSFPKAWNEDYAPNSKVQELLDVRIETTVEAYERERSSSIFQPEGEITDEGILTPDGELIPFPPPIGDEKQDEEKFRYGYRGPSLFINTENLHYLLKFSDESLGGFITRIG